MTKLSKVVDQVLVKELAHDFRRFAHVKASAVLDKSAVFVDYAYKDVLGKQGAEGFVCVVFDGIAKLEYACEIF